MHETLGDDCNMRDFFAPRVPVRPMPIAQLAGSYGEALTPVDLFQTGDK
jgi:hypothetical protein